MNKKELNEEFTRIAALAKMADRMEQLEILKVKIGFLIFRQLANMHRCLKDGFKKQ